MSTEPATPPSIIQLIVRSMAFYTGLGMILTFTLIIMRCDAALIAIMSGFTGMALGQLGSILNNTRSQPTPQDGTTTTKEVSASITTTSPAEPEKPQSPITP